MAMSPINQEVIAKAVSTGITGISARKLGNTVTLYLRVAPISGTTADTFNSLGTLPSELRPLTTFDMMIINNTASSLANSPMALRITSQGNVSVYVYASQATNSIQPFGVVTYQTS